MSDDRFVVKIWLKCRKPKNIINQVKLADDILIHVHSELHDIFPRLGLGSTGCLELNSFEMDIEALRKK